MTAIYRRDRVDPYARKTPAEIERAARDLAASGHSDRTIAAILKADLNAVRAMIGQARNVCTVCTSDDVARELQRSRDRGRRVVGSDGDQTAQANIHGSHFRAADEGCSAPMIA